MTPYYRWQRYLPRPLQDRTAGSILVGAFIGVLLLAGLGALTHSGSSTGPSVPPGYAQGYEDSQRMLDMGLPGGNQAKNTCNQASSTDYINTGHLHPKGWDEGCVDGLQDKPRRD